MSLKSKLRIESVGMLAAFAFYAFAGMICLFVLPMSGFPPHMGIIGILSLITAYGFVKSRVWTLWVVVVLFFVGTTFSGYMLYRAFWKNMFLDVILIVYLLLTWVFTAYTATNRDALGS